MSRPTLTVISLLGLCAASCAHADLRPTETLSPMTPVHRGSRDDRKLPLVLIPCLSGAPWDLSAFPEWRDRTLITGALADATSLEGYADQIVSWTAGLDEYVLVGDSFGALVALAVAKRQPRGLVGVVVSGGFAKAHVSRTTPIKLAVARLLGERGYAATVRMHVRSLGSRFDPPEAAPLLRKIFLLHTTSASFLRRVGLTLAADLRPELGRVQVPVLIVSPEEDRLIGAAAVDELRRGLPDAREHVLKGSGHLLRFTHPRQYAQLVSEFVTVTRAQARSSSNTEGAP